MKKLLNVQYAGDYRNAYNRMVSGLSETYFGHHYILRGIATLGREIGEATMYCAITTSAYDELPETGLRLMGGGMTSFDSGAVIKAIKAYAPTHLVLHTPDSRVATWAASNGIRTMLLLADSFNRRQLRHRLRYLLLARALNRKGIEWIANHGLKSCLSLQAIGVTPDKIIPWDYIYQIHPESYTSKRLDQFPDSVELAYVGTIQESKGCGDAIHAVSELKNRHVKVRLRIAGDGDVEGMQKLTKNLGVEAEVDFVGRIANDKVIDFFREAQVALITSRHEYPEGLPLTIYEALMARTPIIVSDHPMFTGNLLDRESALIFKAGSSSSLAAKILELVSDPTLYALISENSLQTWHSLQIPANLLAIIDNWTRDSNANREWLNQHSLTSRLYQEKLIKLYKFMH